MADLYIFDFDGTLVNTMELWDAMTRRFLRLYGIEIDDDTLSFLNTQHFKEALRYFIEVLGVPESEDVIGDKWYDFAVSVFKAEARTLPGALDCLDRLREGGAKLVLFTLSPRPLVDMLLGELGLAGRLDRTFMGGETMSPKTEAAAFLEIARIMGVAPADTVVVEDSPYACEAAHLAGMKTCGVCISNKHASTLEKMCDFVISDYCELK
ncbi:Phosphorylated carbohydrates phosphatase [bioreactor metagenome]|uniref:Phosphorylated carbohydrates phosphatase n=1 Tax=bioreactor metagenome TaxID=1076179 RepID=A0A645BW44_9ZZZZ